MQTNPDYTCTHKLQMENLLKNNNSMQLLKFTFTYCTNIGLGCKMSEEHGPRTTLIDP